MVASLTMKWPDRHAEGRLNLMDEAAEILDFCRERIDACALLHPDREEGVVSVAADETRDFPTEDAHGQRADAIAEDAHDAHATLRQIVEKQLKRKRRHDDAADRLGSRERCAGYGQALGQSWPGANAEHEIDPKQDSDT